MCLVYVDLVKKIHTQSTYGNSYYFYSFNSTILPNLLTKK